MEYTVLKEAIEKVLQVYIKEINIDSTFRGDLGADSIDMMQILKLVEEKLNIEIKEGSFDDIVTVKDALTLIKKYCNEAK
jgi:acyl carrier protein